jgi:hypothetical protein
MTLVQSDSTYAQIERIVRRLTASASETALPSVIIQETVNDIYNNDFPYAIKIDQMRSVYTFFTQPNVDRYPIDVNLNQGLRAPMYVEGIQGTFTKDRQQFYQVWPRFPTISHPINGDGVTTSFSFNVPGPFLSKEVVIGGVAVGGNPISINDDGQGNLVLKVPNAVNSVPALNSNPAIPGMYNQNLGNPGLIQPTVIGTVDYVLGNMVIVFPPGFVPAAGTQMTCWVSQYQTGRPYSLLFWNNELTIRPVPKLIHKIEIETYLTPVQFLSTTDSPILNQWAKLIAYLTAQEILRQRQDMQGVANLEEGRMRQEGLALERQSVEELFQPNITIFNSAASSIGYGGGISGSAGWW